ncbi:unnamed protein product [Polarella glacialis]|uniref:Cation efflux protein transmembrane domain-containing protein n=1 Tax=Polarella glacialis TaxID=89957 RepID=A0A813FBT0_POLGL|nr:unnamed protein product [Polarella glacialis]
MILYLLLNCGLMVVELICSIGTNSLGLGSDAAHVLSDCLAVAVALAATAMAERKDGRQMILYLLLNCGLMVVELICSIGTNSLGLGSDAAHVLSDCLAVAVALAATAMAEPGP